MPPVITVTLKLLLGFAVDATLFGTAVVSASVQIALLLAAGGAAVAIGLLFVPRWRAVGDGMLLWALLACVSYFIWYVFFAYHE